MSGADLQQEKSLKSSSFVGIASSSSSSIKKKNKTFQRKNSPQKFSSQDESHVCNLKKKKQRKMRHCQKFVCVFFCCFLDEMTHTHKFLAMSHFSFRNFFAILEKFRVEMELLEIFRNSRTSECVKVVKN